MFTANVIINFFIMKKQFLNLGKALNKAEQKSINGGASCRSGSNMDDGCPCNNGSQCSSGNCNTGLHPAFGTCEAPQEQ
jgi:hypothetical protein